MGVKTTLIQYQYYNFTKEFALDILEETRMPNCKLAPTPKDSTWNLYQDKESP